eukprot:g2050.t1
MENKSREIPIKWAEWRDRVHLKCCVRDIEEDSINVFVRKKTVKIQFFAGIGPKRARYACTLQTYREMRNRKEISKTGDSITVTVYKAFSAPFWGQLVESKEENNKYGINWDYWCDEENEATFRLRQKNPRRFDPQRDVYDYLEKKQMEDEIPLPHDFNIDLPGLKGVLGMPGDPVGLLLDGFVSLFAWLYLILCIIIFYTICFTLEIDEDLSLFHHFHETILVIWVVVSLSDYIHALRKCLPQVIPFERSEVPSRIRKITIKHVGRITILVLLTYRFFLPNGREGNVSTKKLHQKLHLPEQLLLIGWILGEIIRILFNFSKFTSFRSFWLARIRYDSMVGIFGWTHVLLFYILITCLHSTALTTFTSVQDFFSHPFIAVYSLILIALAILYTIYLFPSIFESLKEQRHVKLLKSRQDEQGFTESNYRMYQRRFHQKIGKQE